MPGGRGSHMRQETERRGLEGGGWGRDRDGMGKTAWCFYFELLAAASAAAAAAAAAMMKKR